MESRKASILPTVKNAQVEVTRYENDLVSLGFAILGFVSLGDFFTICAMGFITIIHHHLGPNMFGTFSKHRTCKSKYKGVWLVGGVHLLWRRGCCLFGES